MHLINQSLNIWELEESKVLCTVISPDFPLKLNGFFPGEALNPFFGAQDEGFLEFRLR